MAGSNLRHAIGVKYASDFENMVPKKKKKIICLFKDIDYMMK